MEITLKNVSKKFGNKYALSEVNCTFQSGSMIGIVGANGAGKSTLIKILATILKPDSGDVLLDHVSIVQHPQHMKKVIGYLPQNVALYPNLSAGEFLCYMASIKGLNKKEGKRQIEGLLQTLHLKDVEHKRLSQFSGGMKQRVGIAVALLGNPKVLVIDEPTVGLDPQERITIRNLLAQQAEKRIVILSTHIISDIEAIASDILVLKSGRLLYKGTPQKLIGLAKGSVWKYMVPKDCNIGSLSGVSSFLQTDQGIKVRQVARDRPSIEARKVEPTLEDACIFMMEGESSYV
ncbi:MAG TPA: ABC transporter ATP-binding protein [Candidatus Merdenecus merdavium]|nr:ABC transporter ATP-binding protein [Candidatus Merdenecus merdavium]